MHLFVIVCLCLAGFGIYCIIQSKHSKERASSTPADKGCLIAEVGTKKFTPTKDLIKEADDIEKRIHRRRKQIDETQEDLIEEKVTLETHLERNG
jgi:Skp family chaperone for outer membrane proteins